MPYEPQYKTTSGGFSGEETLGRCKQCGAPVTIQNKTKGPTGVFCSETCRQQHEHFVKKAAELDDKPRARGLFFIRLRNFLSALALILLIIFAGGFLTNLGGIQIPVLQQAYELLLTFFNNLFGG